MQRVVVTVKRKDETRVRDIEVPADVDAGRLADLIAHALHWDSDPAGEPVQYDIEAHPLGRTLKSDESLVSAGVWDGSWLVLYPVEAAPATMEVLPSPTQVEAPPAEIEPQPVATAQASSEVAPATLEVQAPPQKEAPFVLTGPLPAEPLVPTFVEPTPVQPTLPSAETTPPQPMVQSIQPLEVEEMAQLPEVATEAYDLEALLAGTGSSAVPITPPNVEPPDEEPRLTPAPNVPLPAFELRPGNEVMRPSSEFVSGWRGLGISLPIEPAEEETSSEEKSSSSFVWKQLDE